MSESPMSITHAEVQQLLELCAAATPGPWRHYTERQEADIPEDGEIYIYWQVVTAVAAPTVILASELDPENADFVVACRRLVPKLLEEVLRLRGE